MREAAAEDLPLGMESARHLIVTERSQSDTMDLRAELTYSKARQGMSAWLAEPTDLNALDYFSPEAHLAMAGVTGQPGEIAGQLRLKDETGHGDKPAEAAAGVCTPGPAGQPAGHGCGQSGAASSPLPWTAPSIPRPAWTLAMKLRDAAAFQKGLDQMLDCLDLQARTEPGRRVARESGSLGGRTVRSVRMDRTAPPPEGAATRAMRPPSRSPSVPDR